VYGRLVYTPYSIEITTVVAAAQSLEISGAFRGKGSLRATCDRRNRSVESFPRFAKARVRVPPARQSARSHTSRRNRG
jgi:hypothetical protein